MSKQSTEEMILATNPKAPRLTPADIEAVIVSEVFHRHEGTTLTTCILTLRNGFQVTGESACASPENFSEAVGNKVARENAVAKVWTLEGYLLKERLFQASLPSTVPGTLEA